MTKLEELLATIAEDAGTAARPAATPPPIPVRADEVDLDDGPILTTDRLWPAALPRPKRKGPPPPPPGRRAVGTAPLGEPVNSGLIDVRAMAAAYEARMPTALPEAEAPIPVMAEGTSPVAIIDPQPAPAAEPRRGPTAVTVRRIAIGVAIAAALGGAGVFAANLLDRGQQTDAQRPEAHEMLAASEPVAEPAIVAPAMREPIAAPEPVAEPEPAAVSEPEVSGDEPLEINVIRLPTQVTEVAEPEETGETEQARPARRVKKAASSEVVGFLPTRPSNSEIASAVVASQNKLRACGDLYSVGGAVPVKIRVTASGAIASVEVKQGTTPFRTCVASALRSQRLPASQVGTTASFPIIIR